MIPAYKKTVEQKMQKTISVLKEELSKIRTGRAHTGILEHIKVDYYGSLVPVSQAATLTLLDSHTIGVAPFDKKMVSQIEKAIRDSDLGVNPAAMGDIIRIPMPPLTEERRKEMTKIVRSEAEGVRVAVRNIRRDANTWLKEQQKQKTISEDDERRTADEIQKLTDKYITEIDKIVQTKESELMSV